MVVDKLYSSEIELPEVGAELTKPISEIPVDTNTFASCYWLAGVSYDVLPSTMHLSSYYNTSTEVGFKDVTDSTVFQMTYGGRYTDTIDETAPNYNVYNYTNGGWVGPLSSDYEQSLFNALDVKSSGAAFKPEQSVRLRVIGRYGTSQASMGSRLWFEASLVISDEDTLYKYINGSVNLTIDVNVATSILKLQINLYSIEHNGYAVFSGYTTDRRYYADVHYFISGYDFYPTFDANMYKRYEAYSTSASPIVRVTTSGTAYCISATGSCNTSNPSDYSLMDTQGIVSDGACITNDGRYYLGGMNTVIPYTVLTNSGVNTRYVNGNCLWYFMDTNSVAIFRMYRLSDIVHHMALMPRIGFRPRNKVVYGFSDTIGYPIINNDRITGDLIFGSLDAIEDILTEWQLSNISDNVYDPDDSGADPIPTDQYTDPNLHRFISGDDQNVFIG